MLLAACGTETDPPATAAPTTAGTSVTTIDPLVGFERAEVLVGGEPWLVAVADTPELRARGLQGVASLGEVRGMLFAWDEDVGDGFWMKDTLIPLDIAFFAADGSPVTVLTMVPCEADPCPSYRATGPYRWALEVPAGGFEALTDLRLELP